MVTASAAHYTLWLICSVPGSRIWLAVPNTAVLVRGQTSVRRFGPLAGVSGNDR
jgi:hypothetical protein